MFSHEKLRVYQAAKQFLGWRVELLKSVKRKVAAVDHLVRASESIGLNIAHASGAWRSKERMKYIGCASGSALECAAAVDILAVKGIVDVETSYSGKQMLASIVGMLFQWRETTDNLIREERGEFVVAAPRVLFAHESLDVYQLALKINGLIEQIPPDTCSRDLISKLDKSATSVALNIAEGNGRYTSSEKSSFFAIAYRAAVQSVTLIDLGLSINDPELAQKLKLDLSRVTMMLAKLKKSVA